MMTDKELFDMCRRKLWRMLSGVDFSDGCKSYDGAIEVRIDYPRYDFEKSIPEPEGFTITLHCYVLGPGRHYTFSGKTMREAIIKFERWLDNEA